ncbi:hypothetical protein Plec18170_008750 [Paecilomyces lecythidis]
MSSAPIDVPGRGEEVVEPASVQAAILLPGSPPRCPELAAIQGALAAAAESEEGSDASSHGSNKSVDVGASDPVFDMELDETNTNQLGSVAGAFAPPPVARASIVHPNNSDVSSLDLGPGMASEDNRSQRSQRQPRLDQHSGAANVLSTSCPVTLTASQTSASQCDPCRNDQPSEATDKGEYHYRNFSSSSEEDEEEILYMKGPKKSD